MDWPFDVFLLRPVPRRVQGLAEIAGDWRGNWEIKDIWISTAPKTFRLADHAERQQISLSLHMMAGGEIGRAYRKSIQEPVYEHC